MKPVGRPAVIGEQQEPEPDLRDEERLGQRDQVRDEAARLTPAVVREAREQRGAEGRSEHEECHGVMSRQHRRPTLQGGVDFPASG
jgi:hypothetical protein